MARSVASQTDWCWLKDLEELARLGREYGAEFTLKVGDRGELLQREKLSRTTPCDGRPIKVITYPVNNQL